MRRKVLRPEHDANLSQVRCAFASSRDNDAYPPAQRPAVRQPTVAPRKPEPTSPDPLDTLIETLDEDDEEISEIVGADSKDEGET